MSGVDEQPTDIPICPVCEARPKYWSLYPNRVGSASGGWMWLVAEEHQHLHGMKRIVSNGFVKLDNVRSVKCRPDVVMPRASSRHVFTEESEVFNTVMKVARRLGQ